MVQRTHPGHDDECQQFRRSRFHPQYGGLHSRCQCCSEGAVVICPGGAFAFRSVQNEGYDVARTLVGLGYQCFVVNYRIQPYTMQESATDLQRAIRYVRAHAADYRISPTDIALMGFSAGGILKGEVLLNWRDLKNASSLDSRYVPDALDEVPVSASAVGMVYSFYGRLSVSMNNVATLRTANLPPAFYCWGTRDGFAGQFTQNSDAVGEAGCYVETHILQGYPYGYGTGGSASVWCNDFRCFPNESEEGRDHVCTFGFGTYGRRADSNLWHGWKASAFHRFCAWGLCGEDGTGK